MWSLYYKAMRWYAMYNGTKRTPGDGRIDWCRSGQRLYQPLDQETWKILTPKEYS